MAESTTPNSNPAATTAEVSDAGSMAGQALAQAEATLTDMQQQVEGTGGAGPLALPELAGAGSADAPVSSIELLSDVELHVMVELGRTQMLVEDVLRLSEGSIVELDKLAGDPVDVYVNKRLVARGEVLVLNDNFCIRISEIVASLEEEQAAADAEAEAESGQMPNAK